ncbi:TIP41-like family-domain-containing protein [Bombardia bombarda]|uniref:TIP41-like family-domain-containing protein n=1 Tax=Bombardia bombarda TaxID=252184 RepID=A0AA39X9K3_9PEZI|nr:TIP41-like family-domain-containing protein [Bombardia bombarda]
MALAMNGRRLQPCRLFGTWDRNRIGFGVLRVDGQPPTNHTKHNHVLCPPPRPRPLQRQPQQQPATSQQQQQQQQQQHPEAAPEDNNKMNHITSLDEPYPSPSAMDQATTTHTQGAFRIASRKLPILKSAPIDAMSARLGIPVPEMIFGDNLVSITHSPSGWSVAFAAEPALALVDKTGAKMLRVAYAGEWSSSRERTSAGISEVVKPYDWSYTTAYRGTETPATEGKRLVSSADTPAIPLELLRRRDPILFADEVVLYESELDDNGISMLSVKLRVMPARMLLLCRLFMRLDNVLVRVRDTRVYVDFDEELVIREYTAKEDTFENVKRNLYMSGLMPDAITVAMRDANAIANLLPKVEEVRESVSLKL